jgi:phospholipase/lecithinase/hemolysin
MRTHRFFALALILAILPLMLTSLANAGVYSDVVVYGDSLSDNGNLFAFDGGTYPPPPYWMGRMSNGPVAVEDLAHNLRFPLLDFAWIGATSGVGNIVDGGTQTKLGTLRLPGMLTQLAATSNLVSPTSLVIVWGGTNDFESNGFSQTTAQLAVSDILSIVAELRGLGVMKIMVPGMPDLGLTPEFHGNSQATALSVYFNHLLLAGLPRGATYVNEFGLLHEIVRDPAAFGLTDVADPCYNGKTVCSNPNQYLFWDDVHPTARGHQILADSIGSALVPEPASLLMLMTGAVGAGSFLRRKKAGFFSKN